MTATTRTGARRSLITGGRGRVQDRPLRRLAPTAVAAGLALAYVIISPPSLDLAAHMLRAKLFGAEGFGLWNNWWYAGHNVPGYSVLFPAIASVLTPQLTAALACVVTAMLFEALAHHRYGEQAWLGSVWFGAATAVDLYTGRLTFAFGLLPAVATALALQRKRPGSAVACAVLTALASPVAALFAATAGGAAAIAGLVRDRRAAAALPGASVAAAALLPVIMLAVAFPEGGSEPFTWPVLWPVLVICLVFLVALPRQDVALRAGTVLYMCGCLASYAVASPVGSNVARLAPLLAGPLAAMLWWHRRNLLLALVALPLLYLQWQAPVRDVRTSAGDPSASAAYYQPLLDFLARQGGPPFRVEIPFTRFHWEAYKVAPLFPLARGWERQLDIRDNGLFYGDGPTESSYESWLHQVAVRFVALPDAHLDYSALKEKALIDRGLPYLRLVQRTAHWRIYAVEKPTPIATGAARLEAIGPNSLTLTATRPGTALIRVHFSPYWAIGEGSGCVAPNDGGNGYTKLTARHTGPVRLVISFLISRVGATSPRCT